MSFLRNEAGKVKILWKIILLVMVLILLCTGTILLVRCVLVPEIQYAIAMGQLEDGNIDEALYVLESLNGYGDSQEQICSVKYDIAMKLLRTGRYSEAAQAFRALGDYKDSRKQASELLFSVQKEGLVNLQVGDTFYFGHYEQDNDLSNGTEELEWTVLDVVDGKAFVTTVCAIESMMYHHTLEAITWEQSSIRKWLNEDFYEQAFDREHQKYIALTLVPSDLNPEHDTLSGEITEDRIFLLSLREVELYLTGKPEAICKATDFVTKTRLGYAFVHNGGSWWWVRTPGLQQSYAAGINPVGEMSTDGNSVTYYAGGIRPAMWIDLTV